jgi:hypothetical protein
MPEEALAVVQEMTNHDEDKRSASGSLYSAFSTVPSLLPLSVTNSPTIPSSSNSSLNKEDSGGWGKPSRGLDISH